MRPLQVDTACVGQTSNVALAALGPNTAIFNFVFQVLPQCVTPPRRGILLVSRTLQVSTSLPPA